VTATRPEHVLPDVVGPGMRVLFCGSAASSVAARIGAPYAGPGNRFFAILHEVGLTPRRLEPVEFRELAASGLGLTDVCKTASGADHELPPGGDDVAAVREKVERWAPQVVAFVGKRAGRAALERPVDYGPQPERFGGAEAWVLPSTSGRAVRFWDPAPWRALAARVR